MRRLTSLAVLLALAVSVSGCQKPAAAEPPSPTVPRDLILSQFRIAIRTFAEEMRIATNRVDLGISHSEGELLIDDLKDKCSRLPEPPAPQFQPERDRCIALVKDLESLEFRLAHLDQQHRQLARAAASALVIALPTEVVADEVDWIPAEEQQLSTPVYGTNIPREGTAEIARLDALRAETLQRGIRDLRMETAALKNTVGPGPLARRGITFAPDTVYTR